MEQLNRPVTYDVIRDDQMQVREIQSHWINKYRSNRQELISLFWFERL